MAEEKETTVLSAEEVAFLKGKLKQVRRTGSEWDEMIDILKNHDLLIIRLKVDDDPKKSKLDYICSKDGSLLAFTNLEEAAVYKEKIAQDSRSQSREFEIISVPTNMILDTADAFGFDVEIDFVDKHMEKFLKYFYKSGMIKAICVWDMKEGSIKAF